MAQGPSAVATMAGTVRSIEKFDTKPDETTGEVRQAARVTILTEPSGGFCEVYVGPEDQAAVPTEDGAAVNWFVTVRAGNRNFTRQDGSITQYSTLWTRFVSDAGQAVNARRLAPTG